MLTLDHTQTHEAKVAQTLSEKGLIFFDPDLKNWVSREEYLSGSVQHKLTQAKAALTSDLPEWIRETLQQNISHLELVQPMTELAPKRSFGSTTLRSRLTAVRFWKA